MAPEVGGLGRIMRGLDSRKEGICWRRLMGSLRWMGNGVGVCGEKFLVRNGTIAILFSAQLIHCFGHRRN